MRLATGTSRSWFRAVGLGLAVLTLGLGTVARAALQQTVEGRVQIGAIHDSNVLEALGDEDGDQALQLFGSVTHDLRPTEALTLTSIGRVGLLRFRDITDDSRVQGEIDVSLMYRIPNGIGLGGRMRLEGRDYADSSSARGHGLFRSELFVQGQVEDVLVQLTGARTVLDYRVTEGTEQSGNRLDASLQRTFGRAATVRLRGGLGSFHFEREARSVVDGEIVNRDFDQRDDFALAGADLIYIRGFYASLGYTHLDNDSNTFGQAYVYDRVEVALRWRLSRPVLSLGLLAQWEDRRYDDDLGGFFVVEFDSEREVNNGLTLEVGRTLSEEIGVKVRLGWQRNESILRDEHYEKLLFESLLEWRF
jgi:hypothetical protein